MLGTAVGGLNKAEFSSVGKADTEHAVPTAAAVGMGGQGAGGDGTGLAGGPGKRLLSEASPRVGGGWGAVAIWRLWDEGRGCGCLTGRRQRQLKWGGGAGRGPQVGLQSWVGIRCLLGMFTADFLFWRQLAL